MQLQHNTKQHCRAALQQRLICHGLPSTGSCLLRLRPVGSGNNATTFNGQIGHNPMTYPKSQPGYPNATPAGAGCQEPLLTGSTFDGNGTAKISPVRPAAHRRLSFVYHVAGECRMTSLLSTLIDQDTPLHHHAGVLIKSHVHDVFVRPCAAGVVLPIVN